MLVASGGHLGTEDPSDLERRPPARTHRSPHPRLRRNTVTTRIVSNRPMCPFLSASSNFRRRCDCERDPRLPILTCSGTMPPRPLHMPRPARTAASRAPQQTSGGREREDKYFSKVIGKALDIIDILRSSAQPLSLNELTLRIELAKSSVFRILHTLEVSGYIERDPTGRYSVAADLQAWAPGQLRTALVDAALPALKDLNREFRETVSLAMRFENRIEVVATLESPHLIRMGNTVGRIVPPHASSLGKAIAAFQPRRRPRAAGPQLRHPPVHGPYGHRRSRTQTRVRARALAGLQHGSGGKRPRGLLLRRARPGCARRRDCRDQHLVSEDARARRAAAEAAGGRDLAAPPSASPVNA